VRAHRHERPITGITWMSALVDRSGKLSWCSNGLTGAEVQVRLAMGQGESLETDPRGELLDQAELEVCLDIIRAAAAVRGEVLNGVVLHAGVAGPVQRPKAPWLPEKRPTRGVASPLRCPPPRAATRIGPAENLGRFISPPPEQVVHGQPGPVGMRRANPS